MGVVGAVGAVGAGCTEKEFLSSFKVLPSIGSKMRIFHPLNSLVVTRNLWLILLIKFDYFSI
jgi:hypothetical protein